MTFNGKVWLLGGYTNDVWSSSNGLDWARATNVAPWNARSYFGAVALNGKMWVMGGQAHPGLNFNDVWSSTDGVAWTRVTNNAPWGVRAGFGAVAFNGQMWVLGGDNSRASFNDVWSSSDGLNWTRMTNAAPWAARTGLGVVVLNSKMWVMGGQNYNTSPNLFNDVWSSSDGANWTQVTAAAGWSARCDFAAVALHGQICVIDGFYSCHDVWASGDGVTWTCLAKPAPWTARYDCQALDLNGQLWLLGGYCFSAFTNDVWVTTPALAITQAGGSVTVSWPYPSTDFNLEHNPGLAATGWTSIDSSPVQAGSQWQFSVSAPAGLGFYRLHYQ